jgi:hypothetical protein
MKREQHKMVEDIKLIKHFASWLSQITDEKVEPDTFPEDLKNGIVLCKLMMLIGPDSGVKSYHQLPAKNAVLDAFKAKENVVQFQEACKRLAMPVVFGMSELEEGNLGKIASCLVFVAHTAASRGVGVKQMDSELRARVESVSLANESLLESSPSAAAAVATPEAQSAELSWWQQLLIRFGFGEYADLDLEKLKAYAQKIKDDLVKRGEEAKLQLNEKTSTLQTQLSERASSIKDNLPESIKARIA